jgi:hypothetical protein
MRRSHQVGSSSKHTGKHRLPSALTAAAAAAVVVLLTPGAASAQHSLMTPLGGRGQLAIDQLGGFRVGAVAGGVSYAGPLGFNVQRYSSADYNGRGNTVVHQTTFWLAPAADYFVIDHLSVGGLLELSSTGGSVDVPLPQNPGATQSQDLPTTTNFTLMPRIGYMFSLANDRVGIWPRGGLGYASRQVASGTGRSKETFSSVVSTVDVGFLFRVNETFFLRAAPEMTFSLGGSHSSADNAGRSVSANANFFEFGIVTGIGVLLDL